MIGVDILNPTRIAVLIASIRDGYPLFALFGDENCRTTVTTYVSNQSTESMKSSMNQGKRYPRLGVFSAESVTGAANSAFIGDLLIALRKRCRRRSSAEKNCQDSCPSDAESAVSAAPARLVCQGQERNLR